MSSVNGQESPSQIDASGTVFRTILALQQEAQLRGQGSEFVAALEAILQALKRDPNRVGEPKYYLHEAEISVRAVVVLPLVIHFGVKEAERVVWIKGAALLAPP